MKKTVGATFKDFSSQWPSNMEFYKRRYMVQRAFAAIRRRSKLKQSKIVELFRKRWEDEIEKAKAAGEDFNSKALVEKKQGKIKHRIKKFIRKHGYNPVICGIAYI